LDELAESVVALAFVASEVWGFPASGSPDQSDFCATFGTSRFLGGPQDIVYFNELIIKLT
jgi:hypothetical protein